MLSTRRTRILWWSRSTERWYTRQPTLAAWKRTVVSSLWAPSGGRSCPRSTAYQGNDTALFYYRTQIQGMERRNGIGVAKQYIPQDTHYHVLELISWAAIAYPSFTVLLHHPSDFAPRTLSSRAFLLASNVSSLTRSWAYTAPELRGQGCLPFTLQCCHCLALNIT